MKINNIIRIMGVPAMLAMMTGCSSDYLDLAPETVISADEVCSSTTAAQLAVNGIASSMNTQYQGTNYNQYNGESYLNTLFNDALGQDYISGLQIGSFGPGALTGEDWNNDNYVLNTLPWGYCYNIINQANGVIEGIDEAEGTDSEKNFVKAEALTFRAFGYYKVLMWYAPRWEDAENGDVYVAPLRLVQSSDPCPLSTMGEILDQIYADLDTAIECFQASEEKRAYKWLPDLSIAQGVYARVALLRHDWPTAQKMAHDARQGYTIMSNDTYLSGVFEDNDDFMWVSSDNEEDIYYWSFGSHYSVNGSYTKNWGVGAGAIDYEFYKQLDPNDIRRQCYLTPDKVKVLPSSWNPGKIKEEAFWNPYLVDQTSNVNVAFGPFNRATAEANQAKDPNYDGTWGTYNVALRYGMYYESQVFKGDAAAMVDKDNDDYSAYYYVPSKNGDVLISPGRYAKMTCTPFGAQYKFWSKPPFGTSYYPYMRASEMCLAEAEAAYENGDIATAKACLTEINGKRIPGYTCTSSSTALRDEIRLCRRIELWGEGHSWSDFKRWNLSIERKAWKANDPTSGNWMDDCACVLSPSDMNGFTLRLPYSEYAFNKAIDINLLPYNKK